MRSRPGFWSAVAVVTAILSGGCTAEAPPRSGSECFSAEQKKAPAGLEVAPNGERVDLAKPTFTDPTKVDNPLFPILELDQVLMLGEVEGKPFRVEVTRLPENKMIECDGRRIETLASQYVAFLDGRIFEVAIDWYAQADDGAVWYFGEDVFNYEDGVVADTEGTWLAGKDGPPGMIMPGNPKVGDVYRPENIPDLVFEEVTVTEVGKTVTGPRGPIDGALVVQELHMDGSLEDKTFAPGYGEFFTGGGGDIEAVALAVPIDAASGPAPAQLAAIAGGAKDLLANPTSDTSLRAMTAAWDEFRSAGVPPLIEEEMNDALKSLAEAVATRKSDDARRAAIRLAQAELDLRLRHVQPAVTDHERLKLWANRIMVDADAGQKSAVTGDVVSLERTWDRLGNSLDGAPTNRIKAHLESLRDAADKEDLSAAEASARELIKSLEGP